LSKNFSRPIGLAVCFVLTALVCSKPGDAQSEITLVATGSSLPEPLYRAWDDEYHKQHPNVQLRYLPEGTAESGRKILAGIGDFGGGDAPNPEKELKSATVSILELPSVLIGIVIVYNLPQTPGDLRLTGATLADIFLGKIKMWNDPSIAKLNADMKLPARPIQVIHRAPGKGANYILADFLCKLSPAFLAKAGRGESPKWPVGASAGRAQDMADMVRSTPWSIGYTELNLAQTASLRVAKIRNAAGEFVLPTVNSIAAAAAESKIKNDFRVSLINAPGAASYPITSFTWLYVPAKSQDAERGRAVADYLRWVYEDGQRIAQEQGYATLPKELLAKVAASAATVRQALPVELVGGGSGPGATKDDVERHAGTHSGAKRADRADTVHPLNH
jgi:phosphate transport system substrate-binding protein